MLGEYAIAEALDPCGDVGERLTARRRHIRRSQPGAELLRPPGPHFRERVAVPLAEGGLRDVVVELDIETE
jgi:hypothetical protein